MDIKTSKGQHSIPTFRDERGILIPCNFNETIMWEPKRFFFVSDVPAGTMRGAHAHKENNQALFCLSGSIRIFSMFLYNGAFCSCYNTLKTGNWIFHPAKEWAEIEFVEEGSSMLSLCSHEYDEADYLRTKQEWIEYMEI